MREATPMQGRPMANIGVGELISSWDRFKPDTQ